MKRRFVCALSGAAILSLAATAADARVHHHAVAVHHHYGVRHAYRHAYNGTFAPRPTGAMDPRYGYEEAPYDAAYMGPGAEVFRRTIESANAPGVALELDPYAKQTATGGPSGGLPSQSGGGGW